MDLIYYMLELFCNTVMVYCIFTYLLYFEMLSIKRMVGVIAGAEIVFIFFNVVQVPEIVRLFYLLIMPMILSVILVREKRSNKIVHSIFGMLLVTGMDSLLLNVLMILCKINDWNLSESMQRIITIIVLTVIWILLSRFVNNRYVNISRKPQTHFFVFISLTCILNFTIYNTASNCVYSSQFGNYTNKNVIEWSLLFSGIILLAEIIYIIFLYFEKTHYTIQNDFTKEYLEIEKKHFKELQEKDENTRRFRHDMKHHLAVLNSYAYEKKYEKMEEYLQQLDNSFITTQLFYQTGNEVLNGILSQKKHVLEENQINLELNGMLVNANYIDDFDLCTVFSNALQNAMEACMQMPEDIGQRKISIQLKQAAGVLVMKFENTVKETLIIKNNQIKTSKKDKLNHGFGLKQIEKVVRNYAGDMQLSSKDNRFEMILTLKNNRE